MRHVSGKLFTAEGFVPGTVGFEDGRVVEVGRGRKAGALAKGLILPSLVNAHTHLGDACLRGDLRRYRGDRSVRGLFCPPTGFKHRHLARARGDRLVEGMRRALGGMMRSGTGGFCDFREGGAPGLRAFSRAREGSPLRGLVLGRPRGLCFDVEEVRRVLGLSDGIAVSALSDWEYPELQKLSAEARRSGKLFALHVSEIVREDIDRVLDLKPSFLVHLVKAEEYDLQRVAAEGVPVVACPGANAFFGLRPPVDAMKRAGLDIALGTDNAMVSVPSVLTAVQAAWEVSRQGGLSPRDVLDCALTGFRKVLNSPEDIYIQPGAAANFLVVGNPSIYSAHDPLAALVSDGAAAEVVLASAGKRLWVKVR